MVGYNVMRSDIQLEEQARIKQLYRKDSHVVTLLEIYNESFYVDISICFFSKITCYRRGLL